MSYFQEMPDAADRQASPAISTPQKEMKGDLDENSQGESSSSYSSPETRDAYRRGHALATQEKYKPGQTRKKRATPARDSETHRDAVGFFGYIDFLCGSR